MTKEKSLSEKEDNFLDMNIDTKIFYKKDVKEAVENLKEELCCVKKKDIDGAFTEGEKFAKMSMRDVEEKIDKIFGEFK